MNSLSWMIYVAGVTANLAGVIFLAGIAVLAFGIAKFVFRISERDPWNWPNSHPETVGKERPPLLWPVKQTVIAFGLFFLATAIPGQKTVYMIAASELGERVIKTPDAQEMYDLLRGRIREALTEAKK